VNSEKIIETNGKEEMGAPNEDAEGEDADKRIETSKYQVERTKKKWEMGEGWWKKVQATDEK